MWLNFKTKNFIAMTNFLCKDLPAILASCLIQLCTYYMSEAQNVGIGTNSPQATLHIAGTLRVDSLKPAFPHTIVVLDSSGVFHSVPLDTLRSFLASAPAMSPFFYASAEPVQSIQNDTFGTCLSITLPPGRYVIHAYCETYNASYANASRVKLSDTDGNDLAGDVPFCRQGMFSPCSMLAEVSTSASKTYRIQWCGNYFTTTYVRRARILAMPL